jgi:MFS family permease
LPVFAEAVFAQGASGLATLTSATGAGAILAGLSLSRAKSDPSRLPRRSRRCAIVAGALLVAFGLTPVFWLGILLALSLGLALTMSNVGLQVALQSTVDNDYRGRVVSLWGVLAIGGPAIGGAIIGVLTHATGIGNITVGCGLACMLFAWLARPHLDRNKDGK